MIVNNNTKDVAYLGVFRGEVDISVIKLVSSSDFLTCPTQFIYDSMRINRYILTFLFDCSGTRYGFRIKELKSK